MDQQTIIKLIDNNKKLTDYLLTLVECLEQTTLTVKEQQAILKDLKKLTQ